MSNGAQESHPCFGCPSLRWDHISLDHGDTVEVPYCLLDYYLPTARCDEYGKERS